MRAAETTAEDLVKALDQVKLPVFFRLASWSAACGGVSVCPGLREWS